MPRLAPKPVVKPSSSTPATSAATEAATPLPNKTYYVISSDVTLPPLGTVDEPALIRFNLYAAKCDSIEEASAQAAKLEGSTTRTHYIIAQNQEGVFEYQPYTVASAVVPPVPTLPPARRPRQSAVTAPVQPISTLETQLERSVAAAQQKQWGAADTAKSELARKENLNNATLYTRECPTCNARMVSAVPTANAVCEVCNVLTRSVVTPDDNPFIEYALNEMKPSDEDAPDIGDLDVPQLLEYWGDKRAPGIYCESCSNACTEGVCENPHCKLYHLNPEEKARLGQEEHMRAASKTPFKDAFEAAGVKARGIVTRDVAENPCSYGKHDWVTVVDGRRCVKCKLEEPMAQSIQSIQTPIRTMQTQTTILHPIPYVSDDHQHPVFEIFGHRSGAETHMQCDRRLFLNYAYLDTGITPTPGPIYFAVGTAVHIGLANILSGNELETAVHSALDFLHASDAYIVMERDGERMEQTLLVAGLLTAFWVYAWPSMSKNYEFLHIEHGVVEPIYATASDGVSLLKVNLMSRPDFIARVKMTGEIVAGSWKTIDDPTDLRKSVFHNDLQGLMETYYAERLLAQLAEGVKATPVTIGEIKALFDACVTGATDDKLPETLHNLQVHFGGLEERARNARVADMPTKIDYVQTIYLVKGKRVLVAEGDSPERAMLEDDYNYDPAKTYKQASMLCYQYVNTHAEHRVSAKSQEVSEFSWSYRYWKPGNVSFNNLGKDWLSRSIESVEEQRAWIEALNTGEIFPSTLGDERNAANPLAKLIVFDEPMYRNSERAARFTAQQRARYVDVANKLWELRQWATPDDPSVPVDPSVLHTLLDELFPQSLTACRSPWKCFYLPLCESPLAPHEVLDFVNVPEGFERRRPHHVAEEEYFKKEGFDV